MIDISDKKQQLIKTIDFDTLSYVKFTNVHVADLDDKYFVCFCYVTSYHFPCSIGSNVQTFRIVMMT